MILQFLSLVGRNASIILLLGMGVVALMPWASALLRPFLPYLVSLVIGLGIARLQLGAVFREFAQIRKTLVLVGIVLVFLPITCIVLAGFGRLLGLSEDIITLLVVFGAAPPLSSATGLSLLLGYNARVTLQVSILTILALPLVGPFCFALVGIENTMNLPVMAAQIASMVAGGFAVGLVLQWVLGEDRISANAQAFNGAAVLAMLLFLFPLLDGVMAFVWAAPMAAAGLAALAIMLNIGGSLLVYRTTHTVTDGPTASALGLMFGNRNVSFYLAVLPFSPLLSVFIAAAQIPIYATPLLFSHRYFKRAS